VPAYLDHAASTPPRPEAVEAMVRHLRTIHANPSGAHAPAREARKAVEEARDAVAEIIGAEPREVVFTSGGTEADNLAVLGVPERVGGVAVCSAVEHHAVLDPVLARKGRTVPVDARGVVDPGALAAILDEVAAEGQRVSLVSVMAANNEVGTIQPLARLVRAARRAAPDAVFHTDAVQAAPWLDVARLAAPADLVAVSAHKLGGPQGVGALIVRERVADRLAARAIGGGQERERRSGTPNVAGIVGFATALHLAAAERDATVARVLGLRNRLVAGLRSAVPDLIETGVDAVPGGGSLPGDAAGRLPGIAHVCLADVEIEALLVLLERAGVAASAAASCASGAMAGSHVLAAMGVPRRWAEGSLRLSLGWTSTEADVDAVLAALPPAVARLRGAA
jgi:cysteine desulfurase